MQKIKTEGIKYAGSKLKLIPNIIEIVSELKDVKTVLDGFSGTTRVSQALAQLGYNTTSSDISYWSEAFGTTYLKSNKPNNYYQEIIDHLNDLKGYNGWFTDSYGGKVGDTKKPFQVHNTLKLDAIRDEIEKLNLEFNDKCVILTSLVYAMDSVDSTLGHYVSYLSDWSTRSFKTMELKLPNRFEITSTNNVIRGDIFETIKSNEFDFVYLDPPYGSNNEKMPSSRVRYDSYYHIWKTIILNDQPDLFGKVNRREDSRDKNSCSVFEEFKKNEDGTYIALNAIKKLIEETRSHYILLSYSSGGKASKDELNEILTGSGKLLKSIEINYKKNVQSNMRWTNDWINSDGKHHEYLFLIEK